MKHQEALESVALLADFFDPVHGSLNLLFANGVMAPGIVVGSILLASDQLFSAEQLAIGACSYLI